MFRKQCLLTVGLFLSFAAFSQGVAISTSAGVPDQSAMLDVQSNTKGLLVPRMLQAERNAITLPATGLLVFQSDAAPGFYYNSGTPPAPSWTPLLPVAWQLTGNTGTDPATHFIGTADNTNLLFRTNNTERMRVRSNGQVVINGTSVRSSQDALEVLGAGVSGAITGLNYPINGYSAGAYAGVYGENTGGGQGLLGQNTGTGTGVYGVNNSTGIGVAGLATGNFGVTGQTTHASFAGVRGTNTNSNGTGIAALGNNLTTAILNTNGSGMAANGRYAGTYTVGTDAATGIGIAALGNGMTTFPNTGAGAGVIGQGENFGVIAYASTSVSALTTNKWAGYFDYTPSANAYSYIAGRSGVTDYGILSTGVKSTMVKDEQNRNRIMYCTEAPEVLFQDFGSARLVNGRAHITIDPLLARNIYVSDSKPLKVFIQLEGDCKGVYVTNKTATGFDVIELQNGTSNTPFSYQVIANRADAKDENGRVTSRFADTRFPVGPERIKAVPGKALQIPAEPLETPLKFKE